MYEEKKRGRLCKRVQYVVPPMHPRCLPPEETRLTPMTQQQVQASQEQEWSVKDCGQSEQ